MRAHAVTLALLLPFAAPAMAADCGGSVACPVAGGEYRIELPPGGAATGAFIFFHGYRGSAEAQMKSRSLIDTAHAHGLAFVAPDGMKNTWSHPGGPQQARDETAFVTALVDDLDQRFGFGADAVYVGGFSQGASMAFYAACDMPGRFAGMVTFAGVFWMPMPTAEDCAGPPPPIVHFHGARDTVFPMEGRPIGKRWRQADTLASIALFTEEAGCTGQPPVSSKIGGVACSGAGPCGRGPVLLCVHDGGHAVNAAWLDAALDRLGR